MENLIVAFLTGGIGAALVSGIFTIFQYKMKRNDQVSDRSDTENKALRYLMLYIIQERAKSHIKDGKITLEDRRLLHLWHTLYHEGLDGNGDADILMNQVDKLPLVME